MQNSGYIVLKGVNWVHNEKTDVYNLDSLSGLRTNQQFLVLN